MAAKQSENVEGKVTITEVEEGYRDEIPATPKSAEAVVEIENVLNMLRSDSST